MWGETGDWGTGEGQNKPVGGTWPPIAAGVGPWKPVQRPEHNQPESPHHCARHETGNLRMVSSVSIRSVVRRF